MVQTKWMLLSIAAGMQIVVIMGMLVRVIGWAPALAGFLTTCALIPVTGWLGRKLGAVRRAVVKHTDARVRTTTEVILGIKAIKLYAWEGPWTERLNQLRETELWQILRSSLLQACATMLFLGVRLHPAAALMSAPSPLHPSSCATTSLAQNTAPFESSSGRHPKAACGSLGGLKACGVSLQNVSDMHQA